MTAVSLFTFLFSRYYSLFIRKPIYPQDAGSRQARYHNIISVYTLPLEDERDLTKNLAHDL